MAEQEEPVDPGRGGVVLDLDGTLVDSVYQHVVAWGEVLHEAGHDVSLSRIHAGIGMGSDRLVPWLLGEHLAGADELADAHTERFLDLADGLAPTDGAHALLHDLETREVPFVIATSAGSRTRACLLGVLGREDLPVTDAEAVASSKPAPDLVLAACRLIDLPPADAVVIGDTRWDSEAALRAGARSIAVRSGGVADAILRRAGAERVVPAPRALVGQL